MTDQLKVVEQGAQAQLLDNSAIAQIELGVRLAKLHPRNVEKLTEELIKSATRTKEIAESCFYALKRAGKIIEGPGIDMAKLTAQKWGNLFIRTDIVRTTHKEIFGAAFIWDFEANTSIISVEPRRITYARNEKGHKAGERYNDETSYFGQFKNRPASHPSADGGCVEYSV